MNPEDDQRQLQYTNLYPNIKLATQEETKKLVEESKHPDRLREMNNTREQIKRELNDFKRKKKHWNRIDKAVKITGVVVIAGTGIAATICGTVIMPALVIPIVTEGIALGLGLAAGAESVIIGGLTLGWIDKKKKHYKEKIRIAQSHIDKMYYFTQTANDDHIITLDELNGFRRIMDNYRMEIEKLKTPQFDFEKFRKEVRKDAKKEAKKEVKEELKEELKSQLRSDAYETLPRPQVKKILET